MMTYACEGCRFWLRNTGIHGECRRHAPVATLVPSAEMTTTSQPGTIWPATLATDWCGEHDALPGPRSAALLPLPPRPIPGETQPAAAGGMAADEEG